MNKYIAVDLGSSNGRIIVGNLESIKVVYRFPNEIIRIRKSHFWDILNIYKEIKHGLRMAFDQYPDQIVSIGIDSCALDYALLDSHGDLIGNIYNYRDSRTQGIPEKVFDKIPKKTIYRETGIQFMDINTLFQLYAQRMTHGYLLDSASHVLTTSSLLMYWLTGEMRNEFSYATTMQLYNPKTRDWSEPLLELLGLNKKHFGEVVPSGTVFGRLLPSIAAEIGAHPDVVVVSPATHDTGSAVAAVPVINDEPYAYVSSGTWSLLGTVTPQPIITEDSYTYNFTNEGGADGGFRFLKNIIGLWMIQECKRTWDEEGEKWSFDDLCTFAETIGPSPLKLDVNDNRFVNPGMPGDSMVDRIAAYAQETHQEFLRDPGFIVRAIIEGLAESYRTTLECMDKIIGRKSEVLHIIGGGCRDELLCRFAAQSTGIPVYAGPAEATAIGNIMVQSIAAGEYSSLRECRIQVQKNYEIKKFLP